jgi:hypothetical protein
VADWVTISSLATAGGTLALAVSTFASVRSANRAARVAEQALLVGLRPLLVTSRMDDPEQKIGYADSKWVRLPGGSGVAEVGDEAIYLAISLRNVGSGIAVLDGWRFAANRELGRGELPPLEEFRRLSRDIYVPTGDVGFWQGTFRDRHSDEFQEARAAIEQRSYLTVWLLYGDHEGGQRMISQFGMTPRGDDGWIVSAARHWYVDRAGPR